MTTKEIELMIRLREEDIESIAAAVNEKPNRVSETINYSRLNRRIRDKLAVHFNLPVERLFDRPPFVEVRAGASLSTPGESRAR